MNTERTDPPVASSADPGSFAEIRETLRQVGELMRENEARAAEHRARVAEDYARSKREMDRARREMEEFKEERRKQAKETDRRRREIDLQMKDTDRRLKKAEGLFTSLWGKLLESLVRGDLVSLLQERGIEVETTHPRVSGRRNGRHFEVDILAVNGEEVVAVEVKTTLRSEHVTEFVSKLSVLPEWTSVCRDRRIFGAVAYLDTGDSVIAYAERQGLFVIRATGSSASIVNPPDFKPRAFA